MQTHDSCVHTTGKPTLRILLHGEEAYPRHVGSAQRGSVHCVASVAGEGAVLPDAVPVVVQVGGGPEEEGAVRARVARPRAGVYAVGLEHVAVLVAVHVPARYAVPMACAGVGGGEGAVARPRRPRVCIQMNK